MYLYLPRGMCERIGSLAMNREMSANAYINYILEKHLDEIDYKPVERGISKTDWQVFWLPTPKCQSDIPKIAEKYGCSERAVIMECLKKEV